MFADSSVAFKTTPENIITVVIHMVVVIPLFIYDKRNVKFILYQLFLNYMHEAIFIITSFDFCKKVMSFEYLKRTEVT